MHLRYNIIVSISESRIFVFQPYRNPVREPLLQLRFPSRDRESLFFNQNIGFDQLAIFLFPSRDRESLFFNF